MPRRSYCGEKEICLESGQTARLYYFLLCESYESCESYGAEIAMQCGESWESASVHHVTTSQARMQAMLEKLQRNTVTPCALQEIILEELNKY